MGRPAASPAVSTRILFGEALPPGRSVGQNAYISIRQIALLNLLNFLYTVGNGVYNSMQQTTRLSTLNLDCETVIARFSRQLEDVGLRVVRSFDLKSACASFPDMTCPHHGDEVCDCQMVILLVYGANPAPASVVLHSHRSNTDVDLVDVPNNRPDKDFVETIRLAFEIGIRSDLPASEWADVS
jgi:hypothetical protein